MSSTAFDPTKQSQSYSFLPKILKDDLAALRTAVQLASKAERTCPLSQKPARVAEREMLEMELGRLRTKIERGEREAKEREVLAGHKKEENAKRKEGKGAWYLKKSEFHQPFLVAILTLQTTRRNYSSKHDSNISTSREDRGQSRRPSRRRGRRLRARRRRVGRLPEDRAGLKAAEAVVVLVVVLLVAEASRDVVLLDDLSAFLYRRYIALCTPTFTQDMVLRDPHSLAVSRLTIPAWTKSVGYVSDRCRKISFSRPYPGDQRSASYRGENRWSSSSTPQTDPDPVREIVPAVIHAVPNYHKRIPSISVRFPLIVHPFQLRHHQLHPS